MKVIKCKFCGHKAKWISNTYPSPLCSHHASIEVKKLDDHGATVDYYEPFIKPPNNEEIVIFNVKTGEVTKQKKKENKNGRKD